MKIVFSLFFLALVTAVSAQEFKKDWYVFNVPGWDKHIYPVMTKPVFTSSNETVGTLAFKNQKDNDQTLIYYVFPLASMDSTFRKQIHDWLFVQSCLTIGKLDFFSFELGLYYYQLKPCGNCNRNIDAQCEELAKKLLVFVKVPK